MEKITGIEYSYDKNGIIVMDGNKFVVKAVVPFLNLKFARDWVKKSACDRSGEDGNFIIGPDNYRSYAYDKGGKCIGGWQVFHGGKNPPPFKMAK